MSNGLKKIKGKKFNTVPTDHPGRSEHVFACLRKFQCPDCGHRIGEIFEIDGYAISEDEIGCACPNCGWKSVFGCSA